MFNRVLVLAALVVLVSPGMARADDAKRDSICPGTYPSVLAENKAQKIFLADVSNDDNISKYFAKMIDTAGAYMQCAKTYMGVDADKVAYGEYVAGVEWLAMADMERKRGWKWRADAEEAWRAAHQAVQDAATPGIRATAQHMLDEIEHMQSEPE